MLSFFARPQPWNRHLGSQGTAVRVCMHTKHSLSLFWSPRTQSEAACFEKKPLCVSPACETPGGTEYAGFPGSLRVLFKEKKWGAFSLNSYFNRYRKKTKPMFSDANILLIARIAGRLLFGSFPPSQCR